MKRVCLPALAFIVAAICIAVAGAALSRAQAPKKLIYACSDQIFEAVDAQKIKAFTEKTGIAVQPRQGTSIWAVVQMMHGQSDMASSARSLYARLKKRGFKEIPFCRDPLVVIAHKGCGVDSLSPKQVEQIFTGGIANWKEVGGKDLEILVIAPDEETAANRSFRRQFMNSRDIVCDITTHSSTLAPRTLSLFSCGAISFIGQGAGIKYPDIRIIRINGKSPQDPDYPYYQTFYYITGEKPVGAAKAFIDFTFSDAGQDLLKKNGLIPIAFSDIMADSTP